MLRRLFLRFIAGWILFGIVCARGSEWRALFNGKDLAGWETFLVPTKQQAAEKNLEMGLNRDPLQVFTVVQLEGRPAIRISGEIFGTLTTLESFSNYHLRLQFKWGEKKWMNPERPRSSGLLYHGQGKHGDGDKGGRWLHSQQFQIQEGGCGDYVSVGNPGAEIRARLLESKRWIYDAQMPLTTFSAKSEVGGRCSRIEAGVQEKSQSEWNTLELICVGARSVHVVNGVLALRLENSTQIGDDGKATPLTSGRIQFQCEGAEVFVRDIEIRPIEKIPAAWDAP